MNTYSRSPLEPVTQNKDYFTSQSSSKVITSTVRQCTSVTQNLGSSQMKRSMSGNSIYSSQINNPPPARQQLGKNLDIVCFLMACEVERFVAENDKLKYRIKEMDDKLLDRNSYEKQIEDLQARLMQMQYQESMYRQEIEITTTQYTEEIENWKIRFFTNEEKYRNENELLKQQLLVGNSKQQKEIDDLKNQLFSQKQWNENEVQKLREQLLSKQQAVEYYQVELNQYEAEFQQYKQQEEKIVELENKIGMLVCETERLNNLLKQKLEELEINKARYNNMAQESEKWRSELRSLQNQFDKKQKDYDQLNQAYVMTQNELIKYKDQDQIIDQMQNKIVLLQGEIDRLNQVLREKIKQGEEWRQKYFDSDNQCKEMKLKLNKLDQLQMQLKDQVDMFQQLSNNLEDQKMKNYQLQQSNNNLEQGNQDLISRIELLTSEIERLNNILRQKIHELEEWKQKCQHYEQEFKNKSIQYNDIKNKLSCLTQEIDRMQEQLRQKQLELQNLQINQNQLQKEVNNQEQINQSLQKQIEEWKRKYTNIEYDLQESLMKNKKLVEYENTIAMISQELERQKMLFSQKSQEFDDQRRQMMNDIQKLKQSMGLKSTEAEEWMSKYRRLEQAYSELSQTNRIVEDKWKQSLIRIILHCSEIDRLTQVQAEIFDENEQLTNQISHYQSQLKIKDDQLYKALDRNNLLQKLQDEEKGKRQGLENQIASLKIYQDNCQILEQKIMSLTTENQRLNEQLRLRNGEIDDYRTQIQRYENKIQISNQELERVNQQLRKAFSESDELRKEKERLESQYNLLQRQYDDLKQKYNSLELYKSKYIELENRCAMLSTEIERLNQLLMNRQDEIDQLKKKCYQLEQQIIQLKQYEENIRVLSNEIDRLQGIIDVNEAELKQWRLQYADGGAQTRKIQDLFFHFVMQSAEIESLRARVQEKEKEVEEVRRSSLAPYRR